MTSGRLLLNLFRSIFPYTEPTGYEFDDLNTRYLKWDIILLLIFLLLFAPAICFSFVILRGLAEDYSAGIEGTLHIIGPHPIIWVVYATGLGVLLSALVTSLLARVMLLSRFSEYMIYSGMKTGIDNWKAGSVLLVVFAVPLLTSTGLSIGSYTRISNDALYVNRYWGLGETRYSFEDITVIAETQGYHRAFTGDFIKTPQYVFQFSDGTDLWINAEKCAGTGLKNRNIISRIAPRTGKKIQQVRTISDL